MPPLRLFRAVSAAALLLCLLCLIGSVAAADAIPTDANGLPLWVPRVWHDFPVRIELDSPDALTDLLARVPVASFDREQVAFVPAGGKAVRVVWQPRVTDAEAAALTAAGVRFERLRDVDRESREATEAAWAAQAAKGGDALALGEKGVYHTQAQITQILQQAQTDHPAIARYYSLGNSIQGRPLNAIVISDNVGEEEAEPEVRLMANIHGDETVQMENLVTLVEHLTNNYGTDPVVTDLVDNTEIHIVPSVNPDGNVAMTRGNANGQDLNRNFPVPDGSAGDDGTWSEQNETILVKNHGAARRFVISEMGHGGALVTNYLWDYTYTLAPDNDGIAKLALEYSQYNPPMYASTSFPQGITNGAAWYVVHGSLQDWAYHDTGCWDYTLEVSSIKNPAASTLDQFWLDNKESLLHFVKAARYGVRGLVTGSDTGLPLAATVAVTGISKTVATDPDFGDYYKILPNGTWELTFSAPGYVSRTISGVTTAWGAGTVLDVQLDPTARGAVAGVVTTPLGQGLAATVQVRTYPAGDVVRTTTSDAGLGGAYAVADLEYGEYTFAASATGYAAVSRRVTLAGAAQTEDFTLYPVEETDLVNDTFEAGAGGWTGGTWGLATTQSHSPTHSLADSPGGNYANNATNIVTLGPLDLGTASAGTVSFWARWTLELNWDGVFFEVSTNGGTSWNALSTAYTQPASGQGGQTPASTPVFEGTQTAWVQNTVSLQPYLGQSDVRFRFRLRSDSSQVYDGFYCDDFVVHVSRPSVSGVGDAPAAALRPSAAPNPFNPATELRFSLARPGRARVAVYDVQGRLVRELLAAELPAGPHAARWDGSDGRGEPVASGTYFARVEGDGARAGVKLTLVK